MTVIYNTEKTEMSRYLYKKVLPPILQFTTNLTDHRLFTFVQDLLIYGNMCNKSGPIGYEINIIKREKAQNAACYSLAELWFLMNRDFFLEIWCIRKFSDTNFVIFVGYRNNCCIFDTYMAVFLGFFGRGVNL